MGWMPRSGHLAALATAGVLATGAVQAQVVSFESSDREMNTAIGEARKALPTFVEAFRAGKGERHAVKVAIPSTTGREHIWMRVQSIDGGTFTGRISNKPVNIPKLQQGDAYRAEQGQITDWSYFNDGLLRGSYTTRVILTRLPESQARPIREQLAPLP